MMCVQFKHHHHHHPD
ncbi:his operon leader peptide [Pseudocitrobacter corydidari]